MIFLSRSLTCDFWDNEAESAQSISAAEQHHPTCPHHQGQEEAL